MRPYLSEAGVMIAPSAWKSSSGGAASGKGSCVARSILPSLLKSYFVSRPVGSEFPEVLLAFGLLVYTWANLRRVWGLRGHDRGPTSDGGA